MIFDYFVDISTAGGKTWQEVGAIHDTSPEEHGAVWMALPNEAVQMVRLRQACGTGVYYKGFSSVKFYQKP